MDPAPGAIRWEGDAKGHGIDDGRWIAPDVEALLTELVSFGWIAEEPEAHLQPHLRDACDAAGSPWIVHEAALAGPVFAVSLEWARPGGTWRELRTDVFALLGRIVESTTFVRQRVTEDMVEFWCATGMLSGDTSFASHGHLILLLIGGPAVESLSANQR